VKASSRGLLSPILAALLRGIIFLGITEAVFYRLLASPGHGTTPSWLAGLHRSVFVAGEVAFQLNFLFILLALVGVSYRTLRIRPWPAGLNGFLAVSWLSLSALGIAAAALASGPAFGISFVALSLIVLLFLAMHRYAVSESASVRSFTIAYSAAMLCSGLTETLEFATWPVGPSASLSRLQGQILSAGQILLWLASIAAFLAFFEMEARRPGARRARWAGITIAGVVSLAFAGGCLLALSRLAILEGETSPLGVFLLSTSLFLAAATAGSNLLQATTRRTGFGLLLIILAGYPLRIAHQNLLMVLGAAVLLAPRPAPTPSELMRMWLPVAGPRGPGGPARGPDGTTIG